MKPDAFHLVYAFVLDLQSNTVYFWIDYGLWWFWTVMGVEFSELSVQALQVNLAPHFNNLSFLIIYLFGK